MIPLRDVNPSHSFPLITILIIIVNAIVFLYEVSLGQYLPEFLDTYALIPVQYFYMGDLGGLSAIVRYFPFLTSQFLHGGWLHFIGNMWFLYIFGDNIEDRLGHLRYLIFYLLSDFLQARRFPHIESGGELADLVPQARFFDEP
ncbi:MAG: rhomboid family intramembrane serine protease, partial [candidate division KSB1 bacterium]|nr:rhomboid family intramembrane serine protease [candidate division KSB1 bacterium]